MGVTAPQIVSDESVASLPVDETEIEVGECSWRPIMPSIRLAVTSKDSASVNNPRSTIYLYYGVSILI